MADGSEPFAAKMVEYVQSNPQFVNNYIDVESLNTGFTVYDQLMPFRVASLSCDTRMIAGAQKMKEALKYYEVTKRLPKKRCPEPRLFLMN